MLLFILDSISYLGYFVNRVLNKIRFRMFGIDGLPDKRKSIWEILKRIH